MQRGATTPWLLIGLALLLVLAMLLTLWAGRSGRVRSRHGVVGRFDSAPDRPRGVDGRGRIAASTGSRDVFQSVPAASQPQFFGMG